MRVDFVDPAFDWVVWIIQLLCDLFRKLRNCFVVVCHDFVQFKHGAVEVWQRFLIRVFRFLVVFFQSYPVWILLLLHQFDKSRSFQLELQPFECLLLVFEISTLLLQLLALLLLVVALGQLAEYASVARFINRFLFSTGVELCFRTQLFWWEVINHCGWKTGG